MAERRPRRTPALHAQRGHAPTTSRAGRAVFVGIDQVQVEVAGAVVGKVADFAADPELACAGKGAGETRSPPRCRARRWRGRLDASRGGARGRRHPPRTPGRPTGRPAGRPAAELRGRRAGGRRRTCPDTLPTCRDASPTWLVVALWTTTVSRPGGRGTGRNRGTVSRKVGTPQSRVLANGQSG